MSDHADCPICAQPKAPSRLRQGRSVRAVLVLAMFAVPVLVACASDAPIDAESSPPTESPTRTATPPTTSPTATTAPAPATVVPTTGPPTPTVSHRDLEGVAYDGLLSWTTEPLPGGYVTPLVLVRGQSAFLFGSSDGGFLIDTVLAIDTADGTTLWQETMTFSDQLFDLERPRLVGDALLVVHRGEETSEIRALDISTGASRWSTPIRRATGFDMNGRHLLFSRTNSEVAAVDATTGRESWSYPSPSGQQVAIAAMTPNTVVLSVGTPGSEARSLVGIDVETGETLWDADVRARAVSAFRTIQTGEGVIVATASEVISVAPESGARLWTHPNELPDFRFSALLAPQAAVVVTCATSDDYALVAVDVLDAHTGRIRYQVELEGTTDSRFGVGGQTRPGVIGTTETALLVTNAGGGCGTGLGVQGADLLEVRALALSDGREEWVDRSQPDFGGDLTRLPSSPGIMREVRGISLVSGDVTRTIDAITGDSSFTTEGTWVIEIGRSAVTVERGSADRPAVLRSDDEAAPELDLPMVAPIPAATLDDLVLFVDPPRPSIALVD